MSRNTIEGVGWVSHESCEIRHNLELQCRLFRKVGGNFSKKFLEWRDAKLRIYFGSFRKKCRQIFEKCELAYRMTDQQVLMTHGQHEVLEAKTSPLKSPILRRALSCLALDSALGPENVSS